MIILRRTGRQSSQVSLRHFSEQHLTLLDRVSRDWLLALSVTSCGLKLDDEAVRVSVGTRLALKLCIPHQCRCVSEVDSFGRHSLVCKRAPGRTVRHHHINDVIARSLPQPASRCPRNHLVLVVQTENAQVG